MSHPLLLLIKVRYTPRLFFVALAVLYFTYDCKAEFLGSLILKFADDTTVTRLILKNVETNYLKQVKSIANWCKKKTTKIKCIKNQRNYYYFSQG